MTSKSLDDCTPEEWDNASKEVREMGCAAPNRGKKSFNEKRGVMGGSSPYQYRRSLMLPLTNNRGEFALVDIETTDICEAYELDGNQKDIQKALHRKGRKDGASAEYDAKKITFYALRNMYVLGIITHKQFWEMCVFCGVAEEI